ncbi:hypothetical protein WA026_009715 [Henosepilachna vigintioctopunctata]|uniref:Tetratricopeptide repeat protein 25 n=1 Tax=Henosepilachna vigintioctopunctata TaxID=420089 RepID=A0AAW1TQS5_9CUCU
MKYRKDERNKNSNSPFSKGLSYRSNKENDIDSHVAGWIGTHLIRLEKTKKGLEYYNEALKRKAFDQNIIFRRAVANIKSFNMSKGTADVEDALRLDPNNLDALSQMMNIMYLDGQFERSLLLGIRNVKYRKQPPHFSLGILRAQGTIQNCVGYKAGHPLRDHYKIIRELAWLKNMSMQKGKPKRKNHVFSKKASRESASTSINPSKTVKPFKTLAKKETNANNDHGDLAETDRKREEDLEIKQKVFSTKFTPDTRDESSIRLIRPIYRTFSAEFEGAQSPSIQSVESSLEDSIAERKPLLKLPKVVKFPYQPLQRRTKNIDNFISSVYLGQLFQEKKYLTALPQIPGCVGKNIDANNVIIDASNEGVETLDAAKEILRTRRPFYHIKYEELKTKCKKLEMDKMKLLERRKLRAIKKIDKFFTKIAVFVNNMDLYHMSKMAELMYQYLKKTDKEIIPNKDSVLCRLYKLVGDGFFLSNKFVPEMTSNQKLTRMRLAVGLPIVRTNSQESLCKKIMGRSFKWTDMINTYEERVKICKYTEELIWLYHELSRFNIEMGRFGMAKNNAVKCTYESRKHEEFQWAVNGYMLMTKISVHQKNKRDAIRHLANAINTVKSMENEEVHTFLQACMQELDENKFEGPKVDDLMRKRQIKMIGLIDAEVKKKEAYTLFENINSKPHRRRLPLIPGLVNMEAHLARDNKEESDENEHPNRGREAEDMIASYLEPSDNIHNL